MKVAVAGGKLQGVEAVYLAQKAGWETLVMDLDETAPATGMCDRLARCDLTDPDQVASIISRVDLLIPALEKQTALDALAVAAQKTGTPMAFDPAAYTISNSKLQSDRILARAGLDLPAYWPDCTPPVVIKPDSDSGSRGVRIVFDQAEIERVATADSGGLVIQEYLTGPSYSIEVLGIPGAYVTPQVTDLFMDNRYDCKRVTAPTDLPPELISDFEQIGRQAAEAVNLAGLMDVEVILHDGRLKILEIDARLPSQTPTVVYLSSGFNIVAGLEDIFIHGRTPGRVRRPKDKAVIYEHIQVHGGVLEVCGEHVMGRGPLTLTNDFYGADEALTNHRPGRGEFVATLIHQDEDVVSVWDKRNATLNAIVRAFGLDGIIDSEPEPHDETCR